MISRKEIFLVLFTALTTAGVFSLAQSTKAVMGSSIFDWKQIEVKPTKTGERRQFFQAPTATLDELECHVTTLNPGEIPHAPHQHPEEELIIVKEGTLDVMTLGKTNRVGPGSVIFHAANVRHGMRNPGPGVATYHVIKWVSPGARQAAK